MEVQIRLFGAFRNLGPQEVTLKLPKAEVSTVEMKSLLASHFGEIIGDSVLSFDPASLVEKSALANESAVLEDTAVIQSGARLALLPPVSGG